MCMTDIKQFQICRYKFEKIEVTSMDVHEADSTLSIISLHVVAADLRC